MATAPRADRAAAAARAPARDDPGYPCALRDLDDAPGRVWVAGEVPPRTGCVAIVGSRAASTYGLGVARSLAGDLARLGLAVVSGLARGIDTAAHVGALDAGGRTVAVLPFPLGAEPRASTPLARAIAARGALLSERPPGAPTYRGVFVERNRLIAALASAVVVVEAAERSGALTTAAAARRLGRPVLAVPGDVDRPTSAGTNGLLRSGAHLCARAADVLEHVSAPAAAPRAADGLLDAAPADAPPDARLLVALDQGEATVDRLAMLAGLDASATLAALLRLEWAGLAEPRPGQRWRRAGERP